VLNIKLYSTDCRKQPNSLKINLTNDYTWSIFKVSIISRCDFTSHNGSRKPFMNAPGLKRAFLNA
jgi:hypothetical protein